MTDICHAFNPFTDGQFYVPWSSVNTNEEMYNACITE